MRAISLAVLFAIAGGSSAAVAQDLAGQEREQERERETEEEGEEEIFWNALGVKLTYSFHLLRERTVADPAQARDSESLGGFVLSYERVLIPELLAIEFAKPFLFNDERFDTPNDLVLKLLHRFDAIELFIAAGASLNIRIIYADRQAIEGHDEDYVTFGVIAMTGASWWLDPHWTLDFELEYSYIPEGDDMVAHEFYLSAGVGWHFGS